LVQSNAPSEVCFLISFFPAFLNKNSITNLHSVTGPTIYLGKQEKRKLGRKELVQSIHPNASFLISFLPAFLNKNSINNL